MAKKQGTRSRKQTINARYLVPGLAKGLEVLRAFSKNSPELTIAGIARTLAINRSTAFRLVYTLESLDLVRKVPGSTKYELGSGVFEFGYALMAEQSVVEKASPILRLLRDETRCSAHLAVRNGREVVYVARFSGSTSLVSTVGVGSRFPAHATVAGRVLLTGLSAAEIVKLFTGVKLQSYSPQTPTSVAAVIKQYEADRQQLSLVSWGYYEADVAAIAAPVYGPMAQIEAAISVSCPIKTYERTVFNDKVRKRVEQAARDVSWAVGHRPAMASSVRLRRTSQRPAIALRSNPRFQ